MTAAQVAVAVLVGVLITAAVVLLVDEQDVSGWIFGGFGLFGFFTLLAMVLNDRVPRNRP